MVNVIDGHMRRAPEKMKKLSYTVSFNTPAFLGNASQDAQWRTPPIKALVRQWWRIHYAAKLKGLVNVADMRQAEGELFGVAADKQGTARKSQVRFRLSDWSRSSLKADLKPLAKYLAYGREESTAIKESESATLLLAVPESRVVEITATLSFIHLFGTLGGRSRNGWGSICLAVQAGTPALNQDPTSIFMDWQLALEQVWASGIGTDQRGALVWETEPVRDWRLAINRLSEIRKGLRAHFSITSGGSSPSPRHWLAYPVAKQPVDKWGQQMRLPNSLRFKVRADSTGEVRGVVFHMPCKPPADFTPAMKEITSVWQQAHIYLDNLPGLQRSREGQS